MAKVEIITGDCREVLKTLPDKSVHTCITSPPYFNLRDYNMDGQIGMELTPEEYVDELIFVFREVRRVLRDDGTLWVNIGDSYARQGGTNQKSRHWDGRKKDAGLEMDGFKLQAKDMGLKPKDLIGIPWRLAFALQADGWYLRQDIIWNKGNNPMPEAVKDRCTKAHEYIFLLAKSEKYYFDNEAIKVEASTATLERNKHKFNGAFKGQFQGTPNEKRWQDGRPIENPKFAADGKANRRSVWTVQTKPFKEAHMAVFPPELIQPCILAGCPEGGTVLDPFGGAGTTGLVSKELGRNSILIELNPDYVKIAENRIMPHKELFDYS